MYSTERVKRVFMGSFLGRKPAETGEANAQRFVRVVTELARERRYITCYPHAGYLGRTSDENGWMWMLNREWRERVRHLLSQAAVTDVQFHEPDSHEGWTFHCRSTYPVPYVATLSLQEAL